MEKKEVNLGEGKVFSLIMKYSLPCIISLLVGALYNIVDQIFIANADYLGSYGNAANTVVFPLTVIALAIAVMIGDGCCVFASKWLGKGDKDKAKHGVGNAIIASVIAGLLIMVIYLIFSDGLLTIFGAKINEETYKLSQEYFFWITVGIPFYVFGQAMNSIIRADGRPTFAMIATIVGAVTNVILDPLFIYTFHMGMMGAAVATIIGQILTAIMSFIYIFFMQEIKPTKASFKPSFSVIGETLKLGITSFLAQISLVAAMAAVNNMVNKYGALDPVFSQAEYAQIPMAVLGIVMKVFQIVISVVVGMASGAIPVVAYNAGSGNYARVKKVFTILLISEAVVGVIATLIVEIFPGALISIFGASGESQYYTDFAIKSFRIYLSLITLACINKATFIFLQASGKVISSVILSMVREIVFGVGFALLLPVFFGLDGVLYSMPVSDFVAFLIAIYLIIMTYRDLMKKEKEIAMNEGV